MANKKVFLEFYQQCMEKGGKMPRSGLCGNLCRLERWKRYKSKKGFEVFCEMFPVNELHGYWASTCCEIGRSFGPLRQTIVLFCAAINGEL